MDKGNEWLKMYKDYVKSEIYLHKGDPESALKEFETFMRLHQQAYPDDKFYPMDEHPMYLADTGDFERAEEVAEEVKKHIDEDEDWQSYDYWYTLAYIESARGNYEEARVLFEKIPEDYRGIYFYCRAGRVCLELGRLEEAVGYLEEVLSDCSSSRVWSGPLAIKAHYLLGICYERSGWNKRAIEQYETFLDIWKAADPGLPEVEDARRRLTGLKAET
jgi:tetratricopeptide (TPR) repeat protein